MHPTASRLEERYSRDQHGASYAPRSHNLLAVFSTTVEPSCTQQPQRRSKSGCGSLESTRVGVSCLLSGWICERVTNVKPTGERERCMRPSRQNPHTIDRRHVKGLTFADIETRCSLSRSTGRICCPSLQGREIDRGSTIEQQSCPFKADLLVTQSQDDLSNEVATFHATDGD